jgi:glycosyltransferase involved in cell wall biosynthesis
MKIKFIIAGSGEYLDELGIMVKKFGLEGHVIFTGHVEHVDTVKYYNGSDIVLNPSLTAEGSSLVLLEAMSCGKPVIASSAGGIKSIVVDGQNGFLVKPGNVKNISDKLKIIANNKILAQTISTAAHETVLNNFTVDQMIGRTLAVMEETARKGIDRL